MLARRFIAWSVGDPSAHCSGMHRQLLRRMERATGALDLMPEEDLLLTVTPCCPLWINLASDLFLHSCPHIHPAFTLPSFSWLYSTNIVDLQSTNTVELLPPALVGYSVGFKWEKRIMHSSDQTAFEAPQWKGCR